MGQTLFCSSSFSVCDDVDYFYIWDLKKKCFIQTEHAMSCDLFGVSREKIVGLDPVSCLNLTWDIASSFLSVSVV